MLFQVKHTQCVQIFFAGKKMHKTNVHSQNNNMKNTMRTLLWLSVFVFFFAMATPLVLKVNVAQAASKEHPIYSRLNDSLIKIYEEDVAHEPVVTTLPQDELETLAEKHGFSLKKAKALIILSDLSFRVNEPTPFTSLAQMKDREIIRFGKHLFALYGKTLSKDEKSALKAKALSALKE